MEQLWRTHRWLQSRLDLTSGCWKRGESVWSPQNVATRHFKPICLMWQLPRSYCGNTKQVVQTVYDIIRNLGLRAAFDFSLCDNVKKSLLTLWLCFGCQMGKESYFCSELIWQPNSQIQDTRCFPALEKWQLVKSDWWSVSGRWQSDS